MSDLNSDMFSAPAGEATQASQSHDRWLAALHLLLTTALLSLVWSFPVFPSQDGPSHLDNASVMRRLLLGGWPVLREYYTVHWRPAPNILTHASLAVLQEIFSPPVALKVLASGYLVLLPLAMRYAIRSVTSQGATSQADAAALLVYPLVPNLAFYKGFLGFCYGLALMLFAIGFWQRHRGRLRRVRTASLSVLVLLLYLLHPLCFAGSAIVIALLILSTVANHSSRRAIPATVIAFAIPAAMTLLFIHREPGMGGEQHIWQAWASFLTLNPLYCLWPMERLLGTCTAGLFAAVICYTIFTGPLRFRRHPDWLHVFQSEGLGWFLAAALFSVLLPFIPNQFAGGGWITLRLSLFPYLFVLPWVSKAIQPKATNPLIPVAATIFTLCLVSSQWFGIKACQPLFAEYLSAASHVSPDSTILPISFDDDGHARSGQPLARRNLHLFMHASGFLTSLRGCVDLSNYEARLDYFPVHFTEAAKSLPAPPWDWQYLQATSFRLLMDKADYILLWQPMPNRGGSAPIQLTNYLAEYFNLRFTSSDGSAKLYVAKRLIPNDQAGL